MYVRQYVTLLILAATVSWGHCEAGLYQQGISNWNYQIGTEAWKLSPSIGHDLVAGFDEPNSNLGFANSYTKWRYHSVAPVLRLTNTTQFTSHLLTSLKFRADQTVGTRIDELNAAWSVSPFLGLRAGVVDYKTSWCRTYDADSGWIRENEHICSTPQFRDATGGAPGIQIFTNIPTDTWLFQAQVGAYNPLLFNYAPKEFGNNFPSPGYRVDKNHKVGFNINALNLETATEFRLSYIHANQQAYSPETYIQGTTDQAYDLTYVGMNMALTPKIIGRVSHMSSPQKNTCRSNLASLSDCNWNTSLTKVSSAVEFTYFHNANHTLSVGTNRTNFDNTSRYFTNNQAFYVDIPVELYAHMRQTSIAWRINWDRGLFSVLQYTHATQTNGTQTVNNSSYGHAVGIKLSYQY